MRSKIIKISTPYLLVAAFLSLFVNILYLTSPIYLTQVYNRVLTGENISTLVGISIFMVAGYLILMTLDIIRSWCLIRLAAHLDNKESESFLLNAIATSASKKNHQASANAQKQLRDFEKIKTFLSSSLLTALFDLPFTILYFLALYLLHPLLAIFAAIIFFMIIIILYIATSGNRERNKSQSQSRYDYHKFFDSTTLASASIIAMGMSEDVTQKVAHKRVQTNQTQKSVTLWGNFFSSIIKNIRLISSSAILGLGAYLVIIEELDAANIFIGMILLGRIFAPIDILGNQWNNLLDTMLAWQNLKNADNDIQEEKNHLFDVPKGVIEINEMAYNPSENQDSANILTDITCSIHPGELVGIVGASGAGKSTLLRLIAGLEPPTTGTITFDGAQATQIDASQRGAIFGFLGQNSEFLPGSLAENIARFKHASFESIRNAASEACINLYIDNLPESYNTDFSILKTRLSGGEYQRLGLARAFFKHPRCLLLDEPTSALDLDSKKRILKTLLGFKNNKHTVIIASHDLDALMLCDKLILLGEGKIISQGPAKDVIGIMTKKQKITKVDNRLQ